MRWCVLGPVEVVVQGRGATIGSDRRRAILAALLAARGGVVSSGRLMEAVWGEDPPPSAGTSLRSHVARLRGELAELSASDDEVVVTEPAGYRLALTDGELDAARFEQLVEQARGLGEGELGRVVELLAEAEALWRGPAFGELAEREVVRPEAVRLERLRASAAAERTEALLALGRHHQAIGELEGRLAEDPLDERTCAQLILALCHAGRQAHALETFRRTRDRLRDELGVDPSPSLTSLHERVLRQDVDLAAEPRSPRVQRRASAEEEAGSLPPVSAGSPTRLYGRDEDVDWVAGLVADAPLVTLTGPGGVGKTRLAEPVAAVVTERFDDGAVWVGLASVSDPASVGAALMAALDVPPKGDHTAGETLVGAVGTRRLLLVLDCCEHVLEAVAQLVASVLRGCPNARVLATSREPLRLPGERVWRVPPLRVPSSHAGVADVVAAPASALFCARAAAAEPSFTLTDANAAVVAELCRGLDGVPLALELAAARMRAMTPADLLARLSHRFELLTGGPSHEAGRHRTLEAVVAWSHDLLDEREARLFERLSVFAGAFTLEAAERVCAGDGLATGEVAGLLAELVDKSMVAVERTDETVRYRLLDTLGDYGAARLAESGAAETVRAAHAAYHVALAEQLGPRIRGPDEKAAAAAINAAFDDLRIAHEWLVHTGDVDRALRLPGALGEYLVHRMRGEVGDWAERALVLPGATEHPLYPLGLMTAGCGDYFRGDLERLRRRAEAVLAREDDDLATYLALAALRGLAMQTGRLDDLAALDDRATAVADALDEDYVRAGFGWQGVLARLFAGRAAEARADLARLDELAEACGNPTVQAHVHTCHGELLADTDPGEAARRLEAALALARDVGSHLTTGAALIALASLHSREGEHDRALALFREALSHWRRFGGDKQQVTVLRNLVEALAQVGADEAAARLHGAATAPTLAASFGVEADKLNTAWNQLTQRMGSDAAEALASEGRRLSVAAAADEALAVLDDLLAR